MRKNKTMLTMYGTHHPKAAVETYIRRSRGGRALMSEEECVGMKIRKILNEQKKKEKAQKKKTFITNVKVVMNGKLCMGNSRTNLESNFYYFYYLFSP